MRRAALGLVGLLLLAGAARGALGPSYGGEIVLGLASLPAAMEPGVPSDDAGRLLTGMVHETLVRIDPDGFPEPSLAASWGTTADGREWTLVLRKDLRFHDGRPLESADVVRSLRRFLRSDSAAADALGSALEGGVSFRTASSDDLPGLEAPEPDRVVLRLAEGRRLPLAALASPAAAITGMGGVGCGPFIPTLPRPAPGLALTAFEAHVRGRPFLDRIRILVASDREALRTDLRAGRVEVAALGPGTVSAPRAVLLLALDATRPAFETAQARAVVTAAVRPETVEAFVPGGEAWGAPLPPSLLPAPKAPLGAPPEATPLDPPRPVELVVARDVPRRASQRVVALLGSVGLRASARPVAPSAAWHAPGDARLIRWVPEVPEPTLALGELLRHVGPAPEAREALEAAGTQVDPEQRAALVLRAEDALGRLRVVVPLAVVPVGFSATPGVHGLQVDFSGRLVLENAWREP